MADIVTYDDWRKLDLRVAEVLKAEPHPDADKLLVLRLKLGTEERTVVAGIKHSYDPKTLVGKKVVMLTNLQPRELRGIKSEGMILAAVDKDKVVLLEPEQDINSGAKIQ